MITQGDSFKLTNWNWAMFVLFVSKMTKTKQCTNFEPSGRVIFSEPFQLLSELSNITITLGSIVIIKSKL